MYISLSLRECKARKERTVPIRSRVNSKEELEYDVITGK